MKVHVFFLSQQTTRLLENMNKNNSQFISGIYIYKVYKINIFKVKTTAFKIINPSRGFKKQFSFIILKIHWLF